MPTVTMMKIGLALAIAAFIGFAVYKVNAFIRHTAQIEKENEDLRGYNKLLTEQKNEVIRQNRENELSYKAQIDQIREASQIARDEHVAELTRATTYKEIRRAINSTPPRPGCPVAPVLIGSLNGLWTAAPASPKSGRRP